MSNTKNATLKRVMSAIVALPVYVFAFTTDYFLSIPVLIASLIISIASLYEYYSICSMDDKGKPFMVLGISAGVIINILFYIFAYGRIHGYNRYIESFDARVIFAVLVLFLAIILIMQIFKRPIKGGIYSLAVTVFGVIYIVFSFSHIILMKALQDGFYYILILNIVVMINDTGAYFGGVLFGKHKTNFEVSPNKSWEGYFSGLLFSIVAMMVTSEIFAVFFDKQLFTLIEAAVIGIFLSILGHIGDLVESAIKRDSTTKDSGSIIPGHGGMWDVYDALIFTFPFFYYYLVLKGIN